MTTSSGGGTTNQNIFLKSPALTQEIYRIYNAKMSIIESIEDKDVTVPNNVMIEDLPDLIDSIAIDVTVTKFAYSTFTTLPQLILDFDWSNVTNMKRMFYYCQNLTTVPTLNTANVTTMESAFYFCQSLANVSTLNTTNVTRTDYMFGYCSNLTTIPSLNASSLININNMFDHCSALTTLGALTNLGQAYLTSQSANYSYYKLDLSTCTSLTHDSLMNVINGLYDIATAGCNTQQLVLGSTNLAKLTAEEIAIATNKGWSVS